jgi:Na+/H+-dicarboxylate symporter
MLFQEIQESPWLTICKIVEVISIFSLIISCVILREIIEIKKDNFKPSIFWKRMLLICVASFFGSVIGVCLGSYQQAGQNNANFSKQLMDEYHATSSRPYSDIDYDSKPSNVATTVLTRDGKDTPVVVQIVKRDGKEITMAFHVLDDNSLYPKTNK